MGDKHVLENITAGMISIWLVDNLGEKRGRDSSDNSGGGLSVTGSVDINLGSHA